MKEEKFVKISASFLQFSDYGGFINEAGELMPVVNIGGPSVNGAHVTCLLKFLYQNGCKFVSKNAGSILHKYFLFSFFSKSNLYTDIKVRNFVENSDFCYTKVYLD